MKSQQTTDATASPHEMSADAQSEYTLSAMEITPEVAEVSFWVKSRNRVFGELINTECARQSLSAFFEIGCATGSFLHYLTENYPALQVSGSDNMDEAVALARKINPQLDIHYLDAKRIDEKTNLSSIGAFDILEHISDDEAVIEKVYRALRPGGLFFISVPQHRFMWSELDIKIKHKRRYSRKELRQKLTHAGFEIDYMTSLVVLLFPVMVAHRKAIEFLVKRAPTKNSPPAASEDISKFVLFGQLSNTLLNWAMRLDEWLIKKRVSLPFGGTLIAVARKPSE